MNYQYSTITPCYCEITKLINEGKDFFLIKVDNENNAITGKIIEKRYELDQNNNEHIKKINHCYNCH
jgi:hypothetical protein